MKLRALLGVAIAGVTLLTMAPAAGAAPAAKGGVPAGAVQSGPAGGSGAGGAEKSQPSADGYVGTAAGASCYTRANGTGDLCLYWGSYRTGSRFGLYGQDASLWNNRFASAGTGRYQVVANNSESFRNFDRVYTAFTCTLTNFNGACGFILPGRAGNFAASYRNNVESVFWD